MNFYTLSELPADKRQELSRYIKRETRAWLDKLAAYENRNEEPSANLLRFFNAFCSFTRALGDPDSPEFGQSDADIRAIMLQWVADNLGKTIPSIVGDGDVDNVLDIDCVPCYINVPQYHVICIMEKG